MYEPLNSGGERPYDDLLITIEQKIEWTKEIIKNAIDENNDQKRDLLIGFSDRLKAFMKEIIKLQGLLEEPYPPPALPPENLFLCKKRTLVAKGRPTTNGFVVLEGSEASTQETPSCPGSISKERNNLRRREILVTNPETGNLVFKRDYEFSSPSRASSVIRGASTNGFLEWKDISGIPLGNFLSGRGYSAKSM